MVINQAVKNLIFIINFHFKGEVSYIRLLESLLKISGLDFCKCIHDFVLILVQVLFLNFFVFDHFDGDKRGIQDILHNVGQRVIFSPFPEEIQFKVVLAFLHLGETDLVLVQPVDHRARVVDGDGLPSLLAHLVKIAIVDHGLEVLFDRVDLAHIVSGHHDFVVAVEREFHLVGLGILGGHFEELHDAHDEVVRVIEDQLLAHTVLNLVRLDVLLVEFFIFL